MAQRNITQQVQEQKQQQITKLSQRQIYSLKFLEMPLDKLEQSVQDELGVNPALEERYDDDISLFDQNEAEQGNIYTADDFNDEAHEQEERKEEIEKALERMESDDDDSDLNDSLYAEYKRFESGQQESFIDKLNEQMRELELSDEEQTIMEYLIGSLDDDGLLRGDLDYIAEQLYINYYIDVTEKDVEKVLNKLQTFDPAGVGARNLQECLLIQVERMEDGAMKNHLRQIITAYYEEFRKNHWDKIKKELDLSDSLVEEIRLNIKRYLTPKPGASLNETMGISLNQITPDFIVSIDDNGRIVLEINNGTLPRLNIDNSFEMMLDNYNDIDEKLLSQNDREAKKYLSDSIDKGKQYIEAIRQRNKTLEKMMKAIIKWQRKYFLEGDEAELVPMRLGDIAKKTGFDDSTISRAVREKYVQSPWGIHPLKFFFTSGYSTQNGEQASREKIMLLIKDIIDDEDKKKPIKDNALEKMLKEKGFPVARRTIVKYRDIMGIPPARLRKE